MHIIACTLVLNNISEYQKDYTIISRINKNKDTVDVFEAFSSKKMQKIFTSLVCYDYVVKIMYVEVVGLRWLLW